jgi:putative ABC transport system substrate-binding protein
MPVQLESAAFARRTPNSDIRSHSVGLSLLLLWRNKLAIDPGKAMRRRDLIAGLGVAAVLPPMWSFAAKAQQTPLRRIGVLLVGLSPESKAAQLFRRGLSDAGYFEGHNVVIEWRYAQGDYGRVAAFVDEFVRSNIEVMVMDSTIGTEVAKRATSTIPIVMALVLDPVGSGLIKGLARPGGNVTGLSMMTTIDLNSKRLELLKGAIPQLRNVAVMWNPDHPLHRRQVEDLKPRAPFLAIELSFVTVNRAEQLEPAFSDISQAKAQALYVIEDPLFFAERTTLLKLAAAAQLPTLHDLRRFPEEGALMSYGPDIYDLFRRSAGYVDRILKGAKPGDLPVEQPTRFELVMNLKTAKSLGLDISPTLLALADEIID